MANWRSTGGGTILISIWAFITVPLAAIAILLAAALVGGKRAFFAITPLWVRQMFRIAGLGLDIRGWEGLPEEIRQNRQPVVFMSNHESQLDPPVVVAAIDVPTVFIAKKELMFLPMINLVMWVAGFIFIDRGERNKAIRSLKEAARRVHDGQNVIIFPEGTRTRTGKLLPFKKGGFNLAMDAGVPIVPMVTHGGFHILPPGALHITPGSFVVAFGKPVHPQDHPDRDSLMAEVRAQVEALLEGLKAG